jgi:hypothetical protein
MEPESLRRLELVHLVEDEVDCQIDENDVEEDPEEIREGFDIFDRTRRQKLELKRHPVMGAHLCGITGTKEDKPDEHVDRQFFNPGKRERK